MPHRHRWTVLGPSPSTGIEPRPRLPPSDQPLELASAGPHPAPELGRHIAVLLAVDLAPERRALQGAGTEVEGERAERVEQAVLERHPDQRSTARMRAEVMCPFGLLLVKRYNRSW